MLFNIQSINLEDIPDKFRTNNLLDSLAINGGNIVYVDKNTAFGKFLLKNGFIFTRGNNTWDHLVIFR